MSHCTDITCQNGNCPGCSNGKLWCDDPQCSPYCRECTPKSGYNTVINTMFAIILVIVLIIILVLVLFHGPRLVIMHDGDKNKVYEADRDHGWGLREI